MPDLTRCLKGFTSDLDKAVAPAETVARVKRLLGDKAPGVLVEARRIDTGRLGIPVFLSRFGPAALELVPTRKQMGKGASLEQAEASAVMELVERYSFFSFFADPDNFAELTWSQAEKQYGPALIPLEEVLESVGETMPEDAARRVLDLRTWRFCPAQRVLDGQQVILPADWFKLLNEFNGSSAGNTYEETILQGGCEVVERHVSAIVDRELPTLASIDPDSLADPVAARLAACYAANGVKLVLKDASLGMPAPTVIAMAWDPESFPHASEIVLTAGTASSPAKAAIRAMTEVAQLAGDFETGACYEPSGLCKPNRLEEITWLVEGPTVALDSLPSVEDPDILSEISSLAQGLADQGYPFYAVDIAHPDLKVPAVYCIVPGFGFRERTPQASLGLFVGRRVAEEAEDLVAGLRGLAELEEVYPAAHFLPFFEGMLHLRFGDNGLAAIKFEHAGPLQPERDDQALCAFYAAHALSREDRWAEAMPYLDQALELTQEVKEYFNLRGVARFRAGDYGAAAEDFRAAVRLDKGSAMDLANLGLCLERLDRDEEAREMLTSALELDVSLEFAREALGRLEG